MESLPATELRTDRLVLTPLDVDDAAEMVGVLADTELYVFTGGTPSSLEQLGSIYRSQVAGSSESDEMWLNWIVRLAGTGTAVGFVQTTIVGDVADLAWVVGVRWQGRGIASEAVTAMCQWLAKQGVKQFTAHIHPDHAASAGVAAAIGLSPTEEVDSDGEIVWIGLPE